MQNLRLVEDYIVAFLRRNEISYDFQAKIYLAVWEAVANAIVHGNEQDVNKKVLISLSLHEGVVVAIVRDEGRGFDFATSYSDPTQPDTITKECGRGLYLMKCLSDELILEDNGSKVIMKFNSKTKLKYRKE